MNQDSRPFVFVLFFVRDSCLFLFCLSLPSCLGLVACLLPDEINITGEERLMLLRRPTLASLVVFVFTFFFLDTTRTFSVLTARYTTTVNPRSNNFTTKREVIESCQWNMSAIRRKKEGKQNCSGSPFEDCPSAKVHFCLSVCLSVVVVVVVVVFWLSKYWR